ncbi:uncharacterized protein LOC134201292 [Bombyx mori]|uniref:uncharacterized protein LOC134201292 n=1 Tax=Bombyx mori TaxID=7091 RepID=UPI00024B94B1
MPQCVHRHRRARRSELWPPPYCLVHLFHSHMAQLAAARCHAPLTAPRNAPQNAPPVAVAYFIGCLPFVFAAPACRASRRTALGCGQGMYQNGQVFYTDEPWAGMSCWNWACKWRHNQNMRSNEFFVN